MIKELKTATPGAAEFAPIMTAYRSQTVTEYLGGMCERYRPAIEAGALATWNGAKANLKAALANVGTQRQKIQIAGTLANRTGNAGYGNEDQPGNQCGRRPPGAIAVLEEIYREAKDSGDRYSGPPPKLCGAW